MSFNADWKLLAQGDQLQRSSVCANAIGTTILIVGGELEPRRPRDNLVHKIALQADGSNAKVTTVPVVKEAPSARVGAATTTLNEQLYMFSGRGGEAMAPIDESGHVWRWDPANESWSSLAPASTAQPVPRSYHCMTSDGQSALYIHAGCPEKGRLADLWSFSILTSEWKQLASAPGPPRGGASIAYAEGKIYRMNGFDGKTELGGCLDVYDPAIDSWTSHAFSADGKSGPGARSVSTLVPVRVGDDVLLVTAFGESDPSSLGHLGAGKMLSDIWAYSLKTKSWSGVSTSSQNAPEARGWFAADEMTIAGRDGVVVVGGLGESNNRLDDAWLLTFH